MKPPGHGETQPRLDDDRRPVVLVVLDGLGDRPVPELGDRTPSEAASTPVLDALTARGAAGWHLPFGWGRAPSSELAHWAMFGFSGVPFPGRAVLEALGAGVDVPTGVALTHAALRTSRVHDGRVWITGRAGRDDAADGEALLGDLAPVLDAHGAVRHPLGSRGESLLEMRGHADGAVTDSDPFFEDFHPWLRVRAAGTPGGPPGHGSRAARETLADALAALLLDARRVLGEHPVNTARTARGMPPLDVLTTKWSGTRGPLPTFDEHVGVAGAAVTSTRLYRGLAALLGMTDHHLPPVGDLSVDLATRVDAARTLIVDGARFVHVHTKATDDAGHTKRPQAKLEALEAADAGLTGLPELAEHAVVAITGDHATPSTGGVLHTGDPTPLVVAGPGVRSDAVTAFGEEAARAGWFGVLRAEEIAPLLFGLANRPGFLGHHATPRRTLALPDRPEAMPAEP